MTATVDVVATHGHYLDHVLPVWEALPHGMRGDVYVNRGIECAHPTRPLSEVRDASGFMLCSSIADARRSRRPVILAEHGVGQSYGGDNVCANNSSYAGGGGRANVGLFLSTNEQCAARDRDRYPHATVRVIGSPYLAHLRSTVTNPDNPRPVVAITSHWPGGVCNETLSAWGEFHDGFQQLAADGRFDVIGHGHPRIIRSLAPHYERMGVPVVPSLMETLARCDVFVADNTSAQYFAAALGRANVVLDSKWYRRNVNHGGRFWDWADIGPRINDPDALVAAVGHAANTRPWPGVDAIVADVFPVDDPVAAAVDAVVSFVDAQTPVPR